MGAGAAPVPDSWRVVLQQSSHGLVSCAFSIPRPPAPHPCCSHPPPALPVAPPLSFPLLQLGRGTAWGSCSCGKGPALLIPHPIVPHLFITQGKFLSSSNAPLCQSWTLSSKFAEDGETTTRAMQSQACSAISWGPGHPPCPTKHRGKKEGAGGNLPNQSEDYKP